MKTYSVGLPWNEVDGLLHHAEAHRTHSCDCDQEAAGTQPKRTGMPMTNAEKTRAFRARARAAGYCARGGKSHGKAKRGAICKACLAYLEQRKRETRHAAREAKSTKT